jgi:Tfp pilus assembly protein PilF
VAVAADPDYADAWAGLAQTYALLPEYEDNLPPAERLPGDAIVQTLDAAGKALALDPASSRALTARAYVRVMQEFDWAGGEADYRAAIAIDPSDATTRQWYGELLMYQRRWDESAVQYDVAIALDPLAPIIHYSRAISLLLKGDSAASLPYYEEGGRLLPDFDYGSPYRAKALVDLRRFDEATAAIRGVPDDDRLALQALIDATRDPARTDESVRLILAHGRETIVGKAFLLATLGRDEQALAELERLFAGKDPYRVFLYCTKAFDPLHADPRFQALLRQINLPAGNERPAPP